MTTLLFLSGDGAGPWRWQRFVDGARVGEGEGVPGGDDTVVAVAPADDVTLHWVDLPSRSLAQATAAARVLVAEASATPLGELHVAVAGEDAGGSRAVAVVAADRMRDWLTDLALAGVEPSAIVPAPLLVPEPAEGFVRAEVAGQGLIRGRASGFADDPPLTELVTDGATPVTLTPDTVEQALAAAAVAPPLDLRQGMFARRRRFAIDWRLVRRLAALGGLFLLLTLAIDGVRIVCFNLAADAAEAQADALARTGLARGETVTDAARQLDERLAGLRGPGRGFSATAAAVFAAVRSQPGAELTGMTFEPTGDLRLSLATTTSAGPTDVKRALEAGGFTVDAPTFTQAPGSGRVTGEMTVKFTGAAS